RCAPAGAGRRLPRRMRPGPPPPARRRRAFGSSASGHGIEPMFRAGNGRVSVRPGPLPAARDDSYDRRVRSLARWLTTAIDLAIGVASVTAAVVVIGFAVVVVSLHVWRSEPLPNGAIRGVRCHWNGHWLIARGMVANLSDQDATFAVQPDVAVAGGKSVAPN